MAGSMNQSFKPLWGTLDNKVAILAGKWAIGATGAVGTQTGATGVSLTRTGVGAYTLQLRHNGANARANAILHAAVSVWVNDADPTNDTDGHYVKLKLITDSGSSMTFQVQDEAGVVAEAPSGAVISAVIFAKLSSAVR
jgi:hypothetical protein